MSGTAEKRRYPRIQKRMKFEFKQDDGIVVAETLNLSASGAYCKVNRSIPMMASLKIVLPLAYSGLSDKIEYVECEGVVVRVEKGDAENTNHIAIFFNEIETDEREKLIRFIETYQDNI